MSLHRFSLTTVVAGCAFALAACSPATGAGGLGTSTVSNTPAEPTVTATVAATADSPKTPAKTVETSTPEQTQAAEPAPSSGPGNSPDGGPDCAHEKCIALTFDDGPGEHTAQVLDALKNAHVHATFFVLGRQVNANPDLFKREIAEGHAVAGHTWDHPQLTKLNNQAVQDQLRRTNAEINKYAGFTPTFMRPPYGAVNHRVRNLIAQEGMAAILWDVDTLDWKDHNLQKAMGYVHKETKNGSIILMHDIHEVGYQAVPLIVKEYQEKGFKFVTIPQLFKGIEMIPGAKHFNRSLIVK